MQHLCPRCGSTVDDSSPFCENCGAPQIRFSGDESPSAEVKVISPAASPFSRTVTPEPVSVSVVPVNRRDAYRAAIIGGLVGALLSMLPLGLLLGAPLGGFLAVVLYRRRSFSGEPLPRLGFRLGILSGVFGFLFFGLLLAIQVVGSHGQNEMKAGMIEAVHRQQARNPDPQTRQMLDYFLTPHGLAIMMIGGLLFVAIAVVLLSGAGGSIAAALLRRKEPPN